MNNQAGVGLFLGGMFSVCSYFLFDKSEELITGILRHPCNDICSRAASLFEFAMTQKHATLNLKNVCFEMCANEKFQAEMIKLSFNEASLLGYKYYGWGCAVSTVATICFLYAAYHFCYSVSKEKTN